MRSKEVLENWYNTESPATKAYEYELHYRIIRPLSAFVSCEGCSIYEDVKKGKTIISDACNFCSKSPIRIGD